MTQTDLLSTEVIDFVQDTIMSRNKEIWDIQHSLWENPELAFHETFAHKTLTTYMAKQKGWTVTKGACGMATAFIAVFSHKPTSTTPTISFNAEYDALPGIGHACGHNLISAGSLTAAVSTSLAMIEFDIPGTLKLFGTPAEENGGGKNIFIEAGAYEGCDVSLIGHGMQFPAKAIALTTAIQNFKVEFFGREAHAAASPYEGINALDAMMVMYNAISVLRQQLLGTDIVQLIVKNGGQAPNIISGYTSAEFAVRAPTLGRMKELETKVRNCIQAGALATGCKYKVTTGECYYNHIPNDVMAERYRLYMNDVFGERVLPVAEDRRTGASGASTDQGNVSWVVPSLHPLFEVKTAGSGPHTKPFAAAAGTQQGHDSAVRTGMCLAYLALELLGRPKLLKEVKEKFKEDIDKAKSELPGETAGITDLKCLEFE